MKAVLPFSAVAPSPTVRSVICSVAGPWGGGVVGWVGLSSLSLPLQAEAVAAARATAVVQRKCLLPNMESPETALGPAILSDLTRFGALHNVRACLTSFNVWPG